jgi:phosphatidyl-myo-inositol dimannoside synthase
VLRQIPSAELWIAGDGDLRADLEQFARNAGVEANVRFHGHISETEKERLIERCRCLALPSAGEGFGLVYLEAMRTGRPCLVSTLDAGREVVNPPEAGLAVNPAKPYEIAAAVARMLSPGPEWQQWSERALSRYAAHFTREHFERRLLSAIAD